MRGWLMAVATIFVSMSFDAMLQPPQWLETQEASLENSEHKRGKQYLYFNTLTFAASLTLVLAVLLWVRETSSAKRYMTMLVRALVTIYSLSVALTFAWGTSRHKGVTISELLGIMVFPLCTFVGVVVGAARRPLSMATLQSAAGQLWKMFGN